MADEAIALGAKFSSSERNGVSKDQIYGGEDNGELGFGFYQLKEETIFSNQQQKQDEQFYSEHGLFDDLQCDASLSPSIQSCLEEIHNLGVQEVVKVEESKKVKNSPISLSSLKLLNNYGGSRLKRLRGEEKAVEPSAITKASSSLSTEDVFRVAGARFIQSASSQIVNVPSVLNQPFGLYFSGVSDEEARDVELAELLLAAAEKVGYQQFESASMLLGQCEYLSSNDGNPVQRIVYYFSEALRLRIDRETGTSLIEKQSFNIEEEVINPVLVALHENIPFHQIIHFTGIQAIVEAVTDAPKVHVIEFGIQSGVRCIALMQALVARYECPVEHLKITAVGTSSRELIEETGARLTSFAQSIGLPFSFKIVMVSQMPELREELFEIDGEESVVISAYFVLRGMLAQQRQLESVMRVARSINPCLVVVTEVEANHNSPAFAGRFIEALFYNSAYFDCLEACMKREDENRRITESMYLGCGIRNMVGSEGEERSSRSVKIEVWRAFFRQYGMAEKELSMSSLYQANLMVERFSCGSCTLYLNGKSLIVGWKGTPINSLSVWNFL